MNAESFQVGGIQSGLDGRQRTRGVLFRAVHAPHSYIQRQDHRYKRYACQVPSKGLPEKRCRQDRKPAGCGVFKTLLPTCDAKGSVRIRR